MVTGRDLCYLSQTFENSFGESTGDCLQQKHALLLMSSPLEEGIYYDG